MLTTFIYPLLHHLSQPFMDLSIFPPSPTDPHQQPFVVVTPSCTPTSHLLSWSGEFSTWPSPTPATHSCHPLASAICLYTPHHVPASAAVSRVRLPPLCLPRPSPRSLSAPEGSPVMGPSVSVRIQFSLPMCSPASQHIMVFDFCWVAILAQNREASKPPLPSSHYTTHTLGV